MLFVPTILTGSLFGMSFGTNFIFAFISGFISYYLINIIPHWAPENFQKKWVLIVRYIDLALGGGYFLFLLYVVFAQNSFLSFTINGLEVVFDIRHFAGAIGAMIPFFFVYLGKTQEFRNDILLKTFNLMKKISYQDRTFWGIFVQIAITIVAITILFRLIDFPSWQRILFQLSKG